MRVRCKLCKHVQEADHLSVRCEACGARGANVMGFAPSASSLKPGEPIVGPSRTPITGGSRSAMRGPDMEPLEVTRERRAAFQEARRGYPPEQAQAMAMLRVPVQCGRCGGDDPACVVCRGIATAPTAALIEKRSAARASKRAPRRRAAR